MSLERLPSSGWNGVPSVGSRQRLQRLDRTGEIAQLGVEWVRSVPLQWFFPISHSRRDPATCRLASLPNSGGMAPFSWLLLRSSLQSLSRLPNSGGMEPVSWLLENISVSSLSRLPNSGGMEPVSWLFPRIRASRLARSANSGWNGSRQLVFFESQVTELGKVQPTRVGWVPSARCWSENTAPLGWRGLPTPAGWGPVSWLFPRFSRSSLVRSAKSCGMGPVSRLPQRTNCVTRPSLTVTPCQASSGSSLNQFSLLDQFAPSVAL